MAAGPNQILPLCDLNHDSDMCGANTVVRHWAEQGQQAAAKVDILNRQESGVLSVKLI